MDFAQERVALDATLQSVADAAARQALLDRFDALAAEQAAAGTSPQRRSAIETEVQALHDQARALAAAPPAPPSQPPTPPSQPPVTPTPPPPPYDKWLRGWIIAFVIAAIGGCFILVFGFYAPSSVAPSDSPARSVAFVIASTIIIIVTFGGVTVLKRLLSTPQPAPRRSDAETQGFWANPLPKIAILVTVLFFGGIGLYFQALEEPISSVRATRPILVFTLIVAMLGFGGLLMVSSLFVRKKPDGTDEKIEDLEKRFRLAREIFLVYAGIFGTIIGFYFGAADEGNTDNPPSVAYTASEGSLTAQVTGGVPPFIGYLSREGPPLDLLMSGKDRLLSLQFDAPSDADTASINTLAGGKTAVDEIVLSPGAPAVDVAAVEKAQRNCPVGATITVVDGRGRRASVDVKNEAVGGWQWPLCGAGAADAPSGNAADVADASGGEPGGNAAAE